MTKNKSQIIVPAIILFFTAVFPLAEKSSFVSAREEKKEESVNQAEIGDNSGQENQPANGGNLRELIEQKSAELQKIEEERKTLEKNLEEVNKTQSSLKKEIGGINYTIKQLDLSIKSNKVIVEKLGLEIESLNGDMNQIERRVSGNKETIGQLMIRLYERDQDGLLMAFLRNGTLAEGVSEVQSLMTINNDLNVRTGQLREFQKELVRKSAYVQDKKKSLEIEKENFTNRQYIIKDQKETKQRLLVQTKNQEKTYADEIEKLEKQQEEISRVIEEHEAKLREQFDPSLLPLKRPGVFAAPLTNIRVTQKYGANDAFAKRVYREKHHPGTDFAAQVGTPVFATHNGVVRAIDNNDKNTWRKYQFGKYVFIDHPNNLSTLYAHLSRAIVSVGETVTRGQIIGYSGNTGFVFGSHLHLGVYWTASVSFESIPPAAGLVPLGITIDPEDYF